MRRTSARNSRFARSSGYRYPDFKPARPRVSRSLTIIRPVDRAGFGQETDSPAESR